MTLLARSLATLVVILFAWSEKTAHAQILDKQKLLEAQTFWDNRDWDWYKNNIPFFECPNPDIATTYYYRWELITKHLTYGSPNTGYVFTEFIDRPFWSGTYGAISCPAGHQLYEVRWLRDPRFARDYARYWFRTWGAEPRRYSCWLADSMWALQQVHSDERFTKDLLGDLIKNYEGWEREHFDKEVGLFWQTGHDDGMEININSRQTKDTVRGAPGFRPTLNSYLWADAMAIARIARLKKDKATTELYHAKANKLKENVQKKLWDPKRQFFFHMNRQDETNDGVTIKALSLTYQTGKYAGNAHGREEIGFVPWQFNLPEAKYAAAWKFLMDKDYFFAERGPTTVERGDPLFLLSKTCCFWSGMSWPYATTQTLKALANVLQNYNQDVITRADYMKLLNIYAKSHRKNGKPYIAEACNPDTGSWEGHDSFNHSEHYFHSGFNDLVITGLVGLKPHDDDIVEIQPLAPEEWAYFALDDVIYRGRRLSILWDKTGQRYQQGAGLHVIVDGKKIASAKTLSRLTAELPARSPQPATKNVLNYAVNNDGDMFPRASASFIGAKSSLVHLNDGNYWYHIAPPNRWTCEGSLSRSDWCAIDFGTPRKISAIKLYILDDGKTIVPPSRFDLEYWDHTEWKAIPDQKRSPKEPEGRRANVIHFPELETSRVRAVLHHRAPSASGLSEFEAWGEGMLPVKPAPPLEGSLSINRTGKGFPKASASFSDRFGGQPMLAIDGKVNFRPNPVNRWTCYESPNANDWLEIDLGAVKEIGRIELGIYDDRGGVQPPKRYDIQYWNDGAWNDVADCKKTPEQPAGNLFNEVTFKPVKASKVRVVFTHKEKARSGVTEMLVWPD